MRQEEEARNTRLPSEVTTSALLVITPTLDERSTVAAFAEAVLAGAPAADVLFVDDASPDGTGAVLDELALHEPRIHVLHRVGRRGLGASYVDGFLWALRRGFTEVVTMDADLSHDPADIERLREAVRAGADIAIGSRNVAGGSVKGWGVGRHVLSKGGSAYARTLLGLSVRDVTSGFKLYSRRALVTLDPTTLRSNGYAFQIETLFRARERGLRLREIPIVFTDRRVGESKMSARIFLEAVLYAPKGLLRRKVGLL